MMKKIALMSFALLLFSAFPVLAQEHHVNVSFWQDMDMTTPYLNEFLYVYLRHKTCQSYYLGGINCTYECRNGRYVSGTANIDEIPTGQVWDFFILQPASFDNDTACPRKVNPVIDIQFDQKLINANDSYDYFLNETEIQARTTSYTFNFRSWLNIGYWIIVIAVVGGTAYYTAGWIAPLIIFIVLIIIKLLLASAGIL
jgi:hypothetical protein